MKEIAKYIRKANETQEMMSQTIEQVFSILGKIRREYIGPFLEILHVHKRHLGVWFELGEKTTFLSKNLERVGSIINSMTEFTRTTDNIIGPFSEASSGIRSRALDFTNIFEGKLKHFGVFVRRVSLKINSILDTVYSFLSMFQLRQRGLDVRDYKPWKHYAHCSAAVCLRLLRRSSALYLDTIFLWKYPHLDDLSSFSRTGKWLAPGLFDDFKVRSITQLSNDEMLLGMRGVASNTEKASLLVVVDIRSRTSKILKIIQLEKDGEPFQGDMGGVVIAKSRVIWISSGTTLYSVSVSDLRSKMASPSPDTIRIGKTKTLAHQAASISYDERDGKIWILDGKDFKAYSYDVSPFGNILQQKDFLVTEEHTRGFAIVRQFGVKYACVAKCALISGYQCRLEFHRIDAGVLDESTILRVVRTPTGLEAIQTVDTEHIVAAFSSGTYSEKVKIQRLAGDFEDRFFKFKLPILATIFSITENCIYFKVVGDWIIKPKRLFPVGDMKCSGIRRKRDALEKALDKDVYTKELEKRTRVRRQTTDGVACTLSKEGEPFTGNHIMTIRFISTVQLSRISIDLIV